MSHDHLDLALLVDSQGRHASPHSSVSDDRSRISTKQRGAHDQFSCGLAGHEKSVVGRFAPNELQVLVLCTVPVHQYPCPYCAERQAPMRASLAPDSNKDPDQPCAPSGSRRRIHHRTQTLRLQHPKSERMQTFLVLSASSADYCVSF